MAVASVPKISKCDSTSEEADEFLKTFFEWSKPENQNVIDGTPKKRPKLVDFKADLVKNKHSWKDWKYKVQILVPMMKGGEKKEHKMDAEISLIQAAVIKKDIEKVKCISDLAESEEFLDEILKCKI